MPNQCTINHIDHIGIAVKNIEQSVAFFTSIFGVPKPIISEILDQQVKATLIEIGQTRIELLEATNDDSPVGRFISSKGEGLHHLALNVDSISDKLETLKELNIDLIDQSPREGLSGTIAFIHPKSVFGVLTELVESDSLES
ncbi:MAG: methylmalonyl-CoA epimerase [Dehalococcoidia bacterium]|nr:methylmalonyl-CoA epimerase [Dehalococcoidia bacterium]|tara:strand:- start:3667 stop:4092 length:426 start_codon:yes stop_codon:yes gene_type:complete